MYYVYLVMFLSCAPASSWDDPFIIPYQDRGNININQINPDPLNTYLSLTHTYERENDIFIMPKDFQGISELYTLGFYVDQDKTIDTLLDANWYRILYRYPEVPEVPEPSTLVFLVGAIFLHRRKRCTPRYAQCA